LKIERESQFNTAGGSEFQVRGAAVLKDRLANDVRRNGTYSSGTDDDRVDGTWAPSANMPAH